MGKDLKGKELGAGLSQRKDKTYQGRYKDRYGKINYVYGKKLSDVRDQLAQEISNNLNFANIRDEVKLDAWFDRWVDVYKRKGVRPNTLREYTHVYKKNISPFIGERKLNSLVQADIQNLIDIADDSGYKYEQQNKIKVVLSDMFKRAIDNDLMLKNPAANIKLRKSKEVHAFALSEEEQEIFFDVSLGTFYDPLFNVAVQTGLRPGELFALTISDIDFDKGHISVNKTLVYQKYLDDEKKTFHIEPPKTKQSNRKVPINSICKSYLLKQIQQKKVVCSKRPKEENDFLFVTRYNTPLNSVLYSQAIKSIVQEINLTRPFDNQFPVFGGHTFRHTFATRCFECGIEAKVVQSYLGHASLQMTMDLYTHVTEKKAEEDIEKLVKNPSTGVIDIDSRRKCV